MFRSSILFSLILFSFGCTPPAKPFTGSKGAVMGTPSTASIGMTGGSLVAGALTVTVPPGVFAQSTMLSVTPINSTVPGKRGQALRLEPEGMTFSAPVTLTFHYGDSDLEGTSPEALMIAYQHSSGMWAVPGEVTLDTAARTVSVSTTHFSDWSLVAGSQLRPPSATVKVKGSLTLVARRCFSTPESQTSVDVELAPLLIGFPCDADEELAPLPVATSDWSVNGVTGGSASTGTIAGELAQGIFTAPSTKPSPATVAVSARVDLAKKGKVLLVSNITIKDGSQTIRVRGKYSKAERQLTTFVIGDVEDEGFQFDMAFPVTDSEPEVINKVGAVVTKVKDTRSGCLGPSLGGEWDEMTATSVSITGSFVTISGSQSFPPITLGVGEGDCQQMSRVEPARSGPTGIQFGLPLQFFTSETPPAAPITTTEGGWSLTYTTLAL